ncbi:MAG: polysaccharide pyruvyl transferase family protein [Chromatiales bacterium]|jgi:pyruvyl transferase EpsO
MTQEAPRNRAVTSDIGYFWTTLQQIAVSRLRPEIPQGSKIVFFDFPVYGNVGDLMIWHGTLAWIRREKLVCQQTQTMLDRRFPSIDVNAIIICQGGGNFGDLYEHQDYREEIVQKYPDNKIVFLPQTIFYKNQANLQKTAHILNQHSNLVIYLRDETSIDIANTYFKNAKILSCPDMASFLYPLLDTNQEESREKYNRLYLKRLDIEQLPETYTDDINIDWQGDWRNINQNEEFMIRLLQAVYRLLPPLRNSSIIYNVWKKLSLHMICKSARKFSIYQEIITSRLHGHILALLVEKPVWLLDNSYGKNRDYYLLWHQDCPLVELVRPKNYL